MHRPEPFSDHMVCAYFIRLARICMEKLKLAGRSCCIPDATSRGYGVIR